VSNTSREVALGHLALHAQTVRVVRAIRDAGAGCLLLKGIGHELWLYPDGARPISRDVDVLIEPGKLQRAREAVVRLGMQPSRDELGPLREEHELRFEPADGSRPFVELHNSFGFLEAPPERRWALLTADGDQIEVGGEQIDVPSVPARALLLVLHVARHGRAGDWAIEDLRRALDVVSLDEWQRAAGLAGALGASAAFSSGLQLLPAGIELADALGLVEPEDPSLRLHRQSASRWALRMTEYAHEPAFPGLAHLLRAELIPPAQRMRTWYPLARRGWRGLVAAHVVRLGRFGLTSPWLLANWRQARAASRRG
jgi:Uncharacterised nucleotidyltransferase